MPYLIRQLIKTRMPVNFVFGWFIEDAGIGGVGGMDVFAFHYPDADAFHAAGVDVACVFHGHLCVRGMKAANMFMVEALLAADEDLPEGPVGSVRTFLQSCIATSLVLGDVAVIIFSQVVHIFRF